MELQVGVKAVLKNKEGKYLLLRRSRLKYPDFKGAWDIAGGRIDPGTTLLENLKREVKEETSLDLNDEKLELVAAQDILRIQGKHVVRLTYVGGGRYRESLLSRTNTKHMAGLRLMKSNSWARTSSMSISRNWLMKAYLIKNNYLEAFEKRG